MRDIQISRPVLIAIVGAILVGGFVLYSSNKSDEVIAPIPVATTGSTAATGAIGSSAKTGKHKKKQTVAVVKKHSAVAVTGVTGASGSTGSTGGTGATGAPKTRAEIKAERRKKLVAAAKAAGMPVNVYLAKRAGKEVVIFFWEPRGKDDKRTNDALLNVKAYRKGHTVVFRDKISNTSHYDGIAQAGQLTQTPSMVILYRNKADTAQGFYDAGAINQKIVRLSGYIPPGS